MVGIEAEAMVTVDADKDEIMQCQRHPRLHCKRIHKILTSQGARIFRQSVCALTLSESGRCSCELQVNVSSLRGDASCDEDILVETVRNFDTVNTVENKYKNTARYIVGNTFICVLDDSRCACILLINTCIFMHILTYVLPITVSVYASMYWKYMHILLQTRQYTAHWKSYMCKYVHILHSTYR